MKPITTIHEIELSSRCNLACVYCPSPTMKRAKEDMQWETYLQALRVVKHYVDIGTQGELALTGVGEALLHPRFAEAVLLARETIGPNRELTFSTNGILLTQELLEELLPAMPIIYVSLHRPEVAAPAMQLAQHTGFKTGHNYAFATSALDWAGQVDWQVSAPKDIVCEYLRSGWAVIRADGTVGACCWDAESAISKLGTVFDDPSTLVTAPHAACNNCSLIH